MMGLIVEQDILNTYEQDAAPFRVGAIETSTSLSIRRTE